MAVEYWVEYWETSNKAGTLQRVTGITTSDYTLTGLTQDIEYDWTVQAVDVVGGVYYPSPKVDGAAFTTVAGPVTINLGLASESDSASAIQASNDVTAPVITLLGTSKESVKVGTSWVDPGYTATDDTDGDITGNVIVGGDTVDANTIGIYTITYNVSDAAGNPATEVTREVHVANEVAATNWNLEYQEVGNQASLVQVNDLSASDYSATGLTASTNYEFRVQAYAGTGISDWSSWTQFQTSADAGVTVNLGISSETDSANATTASIDADTTANITTANESNTAIAISSDVSGAITVALGQAIESDTGNSIAADVVTPIEVVLGIASETDLSLDITPSSQPVVQATLWDVEIVDEALGSTVLIQDLNSSNYTATLNPHNPYKFRVKGFYQGRTYESAWSGYVSFVTLSNPVNLTTTESVTGDLDVFSITISDTVTANEAIDILGTVSNANCSLSFSDLNGTPLELSYLYSTGDFVAINTNAVGLALETPDGLDYESFILLEGDTSDLYGQTLKA